MQEKGQVILTKHKSDEMEAHHSYGLVIGVLLVVGMAIIIGLLWKMCKHKH
jgi:hypothetical protein